MRSDPQSDPLVVVFQKTPEGTLEEVGRTEYLKYVLCALSHLRTPPDSARHPQHVARIDAGTAGTKSRPCSARR